VNPLDDGIGILIPANARIVMQVHYHPSGSSTPDRTLAGFYFSPPNSVQHRLLSLPLVNTTFKIPANNPNYEVDAKFQVPFFLSGKAVLILPHMHLLGRQIAVNLTDSSGTVTPLVRIDDWDFNWQGSYMYTQAIPIPANSMISLKSFYDNSDQNLKNPNSPIVAVKWGEGTTDEMCIALVGVVIDNEALLNSLF
jgi:Copper type II ascorbate-dependent monooxygenase, C-terminal domain